MYITTKVQCTEYFRLKLNFQLLLNKFVKSYKNKKSERQTNVDCNLIERTDNRLKMFYLHYLNSTK